MFRKMFAKVSRWLLPALLPPSWGVWGTRGGSTITTREALGLSAVWACIDVIARGLAPAPWNVYELAPGDSRKRRLLDADPIAWLLNTAPNPEMTAISFRSALVWQLIPNGRAFVLIERRGGKPVALWPMESCEVNEQRDERGDLVYLYRGETFSSDEVLHFVGPGADPWNGDNLLQRALGTIGLSYAVQEAALDFFARGAQPAGVFSSPLMLGAPRKQKMIADFEEFYSGRSNSYRPLVLDGGITFQPLSPTQRDSMSLEERKFLVEEVCRWFGVPPHKVALLDHATFSNIEHSSIEFVRDCLTPWSKRFSQEVDRKLFSQRSPWRQSEIDLRGLTQGDFPSRATAYGSMHTNGLMSANEIREREGLNDVGPDGDVRFMQGALMPVSKLVAEPAPPPAPPAAEILNETRIEMHAMAAAVVSEAWKRYEARAANRGERSDSDDWRDKQAAQLAREVAPFEALSALPLPTETQFREGMRVEKCPSI